MIWYLMVPPSHEYLAELEPLGWIHTQPNELPQLSPQVGYRGRPQEAPRTSRLTRRISKD